MNNLGYACINTKLSAEKITTNRSMIKKTFLQKGMSYASELAFKNCQDLITILKWNDKHNIRLFRISSDMFPWASEYNIEELPDFKEIELLLKEAGNISKQTGQRLTSHPGPFNKLCSDNPRIVSNTIIDLANHGKVFDLIGLSRTPFNKINIHVGGTYGDKEKAAHSFIKNFDSLPDSVKTRLTVENDDRESLFSTIDLYNLIYSKIKIPITFDFHHHLFCNGGQTEEEALTLAISTWGDIKPIVHYSESKADELKSNKIKPQAHSDFIYKEIKQYNKSIDIMIEAKAKEAALLKYREIYAEKS